MRRETKFETLRNNHALILLAAFFIFLGIFLIALPFILPSERPKPINIGSSISEFLAALFSRGRYALPEDNPLRSLSAVQFIFAFISIAFGLLVLLFIRWDVRRRQRSNSDRDRRIAKKYGFPFPCEIDGARVLEYASLKAHPTAEYAAICQYPGENRYMLFLLDKGANVIEDHLFDSIKTCENSFSGIGQVFWLKI